MTGSKNMSVLQIDALREISNIGLGHAVTSLAELTNRKINMTVPRSGFFPFEEIVELVGGYEEQVSCVSLNLLGDVPGLVMFIFNQQSTYYLVDMLTDQATGSTTNLDELGQSAVMEVGNILTGSFINVIGSMTNLTIRTTVPIFAFDMLGAVLSSLLVAVDRIDEQVMVIETQLFQETMAIKGHFFLMSDPEANNRLFTSLGLNT